MRQATYWRIAGASEPTAHTWRFASAQTAVGSILAYDGVSAAAPIHAVSGQPNLASKSITAPSVTTTAPGVLVVDLSGITGKAAVTPASGATERSEIVSTAAPTYFVSAETADFVPSQVGATGTKVATSSVTGANIGQLVALTPE